jgi:hypothetical protein
MFTDFRRERSIRRVLRALARQRVAAILQPGGVWLVERAPTNLPFMAEALQTCMLRGWVEVLHHAVPSGALSDKAELQNGPIFQGTKTIYRLTESGWAVINRTQAWIIATFLVALLGVMATIVAAWK